MEYTTKTEQEQKSKKQISNSYSLVLYNDDVNTFDHVINCLIRICQHDVVQAEQCAWLVHNRGKCNIKSGKPYYFEKNAECIDPKWFVSREIE